jgi:hypothetical protein
MASPKRELLKTIDVCLCGTAGWPALDAVCLVRKLLKLCPGLQVIAAAAEPMADRPWLGLSLLLLLSAYLSPARADNTAILPLKITPGPNTRIVTNATELGKALQDHMITNIILKGEGYLPESLLDFRA